MIQNYLFILSLLFTSSAYGAAGRSVLHNIIDSANSETEAWQQLVEIHDRLEREVKNQSFRNTLRRAFGRPEVMVVDVEDEQGDTPWRRAIKKGYGRVAKFLKGGILKADPNHRNGNGDTILHHLVATPVFNKDIFESAVQAGADINALNNQRRTPLIEAVKAGNNEAVRYILFLEGQPDGDQAPLFDRDLDIEDVDGKRAVDYGYVLGPDVYELLQSASNPELFQELF